MMRPAEPIGFRDVRRTFETWLALRAETNSGGLLPKTGSLQPEWRRCGKSGCHCAGGTLHGPYWYLRWREDGRQRRQYVPREQVDTMRAALEQRRQLHPPVWSLRQELAGLRQLAQEVHNAAHD